MNDQKDILKIEQLRVSYDRIRAVDGVDLSVGYGECVGLVGESGCGKSTLGRAVLRLEEIQGGRLFFRGKHIEEFEGEKLRHFREQAQMVFQDPYSSLNPRIPVGKAIEEVLKVHHIGMPKERRGKVAELLDSVGLDERFMTRFPHEFSGGQRQRIGIARALALQPRFIIADEPVSALDVSVQVQILNLLKELQEEHRLSYLFIAHDLAVVRYMCTRIYVMYLGKIVEHGPAQELYNGPLHPYTEALLSAVPTLQTEQTPSSSRQRIIVKGDIPSPAKQIPGCPFHTRCHRARERCEMDRPELREIEPGHWTACLFAEEMTSGDNGSNA